MNGGYTPACGQAQTHTFHEYMDEQFKTQWCRGLCDCGMYGPHGPGEHK